MYSKESRKNCRCRLHMHYDSWLVSVKSYKMVKSGRNWRGKKSFIIKLRRLRRLEFIRIVCGIMTGAYFSIENVILNNFIYIRMC